MRNVVLGTAVAVVLGLATPAGAMPLGWPGAIGGAAGNQVEPVTYGVVCRERCGYYGCRRVCFRPSYGHAYGYYRPHYYRRPYWGGGWGY
jgi:hypothetical protein